MLAEMEKSLQRLIDISNQGVAWDAVEILTYLTCKEIENKYLLMVITPANLKTLEIIKEEFEEEVSYIADFDKQTKKQRIYLYDLVKAELEGQEPKVENIIQILREYCIIVKKDAGLKELKDTLKVGQILAGGKKHPIYVMNLFPPEGRFKFSNLAQANFTKYLNKIIQHPVKLTNISFGKEDITVTVETSFKLHLDDVTELIDYIEKEDNNGKDASSIINHFKDRAEENIVKHPLLSGLKFNMFGPIQNARLYIFEDWFNEVRHLADRATKTSFSIKADKQKYNIYATNYPEHCDELVFEPQCRRVGYDDFIERLFKFTSTLDIKDVI